MLESVRVLIGGYGKAPTGHLHIPGVFRLVPKYLTFLRGTSF